MLKVKSTKLRETHPEKWFPTEPVAPAADVEGEKYRDEIGGQSDDVGEAHNLQRELEREETTKCLMPLSQCRCRLVPTYDSQYLHKTPQSNCISPLEGKKDEN